MVFHSLFNWPDHCTSQSLHAQLYWRCIELCNKVSLTCFPVNSTSAKYILHMNLLKAAQSKAASAHSLFSCKESNWGLMPVTELSVYLCMCVCAEHLDRCFTLSGCVSPLWLRCSLEYSPAVKSLRFHLASWPPPPLLCPPYPSSHLCIFFLTPNSRLGFLLPATWLFLRAVFECVLLVTNPGTMLMGMPCSALSASHK